MENLGIKEASMDIFKGKRVFITGHTGFKGTWLSAILYRLGAELKGYSLPAEDSAPFFNLFQERIKMEHVFDDIRNKELLEEEILKFQPDFIFHLAAQPLVLRSYKEPAYTFEVNVVGTANLLYALTSLKKPCTTVISTTDKVYLNKEVNVLYKEEDRLGGYDPYSASKACTELTIASMRNSFFNIEQYASHQQVISVGRAGNVIGGGDWSENRIVPDIAKSLLNGQKIKLRNPDAIRPWQHVLEPLMGYMKLAVAAYSNRFDYNKAYNFGPHSEDHLTVYELAQLAIETWGDGEIEMVADPNKPHEATILKLDISKAKAELDWTPLLTARQAIEWTMEWYKTDDLNKADKTFQQIEDYFSLCK